MKLLSLHISSFKRFDNGAEINSFSPGLNLFTGPNEAGKSTLVSAIRTAFFERHRSGLTELRPWSDSSASPSIELSFEHDGHQYQLSKRFLGRKRCELIIDDMRYEGDEAEEQLKLLLGFEQAKSGKNKRDNLGIPGLLWIQQGDAQNISEPVTHASQRLHTLLESMLGTVSATGGDQLISKVQALRDELLTPSTGKPKGEYDKALKARDEFKQQLNELDQSIQHYQSRVDELARLRDEQQQEQQENTTAQLRAQLTEAQQKLDELTTRQHHLKVQAENVERLIQQRNWANELLSNFDKEQHESAKRQETVSQSQTRLEQAQQSVSLAKQHVSSLKETYTTLRQRLNHAQKYKEQSLLNQRINEFQSAHTTVTEQITHAQEATEQLQRLVNKRLHLDINTDDVAKLRSEHVALTKLDIQLNATAPLLEFDLLDGQYLTLGKQVVSGKGQHRVLEQETLDISGFGRLSLTPGGSNLGPIATRYQSTKERYQALLHRLQVDSVESAEQRLDALRDLDVELKVVQSRLDAYAPHGIDVLRERQNQLEVDIARHIGKQNQYPHTSQQEDDAQIFDLEQLESEAQQYIERIEKANKRLHEAQIEQSSYQAQHASHLQELERTQHRLNDPERLQRISEQQNKSNDLRIEIAAEQQKLTVLETQLSATQPDLLAQDVERLQKSLDQQLRHSSERHDRLIRLEAELASIGAQGLEEKRAQLAPELARQHHRCQEFERRANALSLLLTRLQEKRQHLIQQLQAPLLNKIKHYLRILFPDAQLTLNEQLVPTQLQRNSAPSRNTFENGKIDELSFGAREQLGVISRLAYADLLGEAGHPTLIILDDALVHADNQRLGQMKRVLFDAATRHQMLIFSCHPAAWNDLGVEARSVNSFVLSN